MESIKPKNDVYLFIAQAFKTLAASLVQRVLSPPQLVNNKLNLKYLKNMINQTKIFLLFSSIINILFVIAFALLIANKCGFSYLSNKLLHFFPENNSKHFNYPAYYWHKKSQFEKLPKSESDIIMLGDSITDEGEWTELLGLNVKNRGISGDTTERILHRLDSILESKPKQVFLMIGINDLMNDGKSVTVTLEQYKKILREFKKKTQIQKYLCKVSYLSTIKFIYIGKIIIT
nr:GDSL-type esterase/lipase family protein [[Scytonema hofmanni] UTEX B 1581]